MDNKDKNPAPGTTDAGAAGQSAADDGSTINLDNVDPRLVLPDDDGGDAGQDDGGTPPSDNGQQGDDGAAADPPQPPADNPPASDANNQDGDGNQDDNPPSRRENKRISVLTRQLQEARNAAMSQPSNPQMPQGNQRQVIEPGDYSLDQINGMANQYGDQRFTEGQQAGLATANSIQFMTRLEIDAPKVEAKHEALNPQSDKFDPGVTDWMTNLYYQTVGLKAKPDGSFTVANPNIRYADFADAFMEAVDTLAASKSADSTAARQKRAAQAGVRPNGAAKTATYTGDDPNKMTLDQLRAKVNQELGIS